MSRKISLLVSSEFVSALLSDTQFSTSFSFIVASSVHCCGLQMSHASLSFQLLSLSGPIKSRSSPVS